MISGSIGKTLSKESYLQPVDEPKRTDYISFLEYCLVSKDKYFLENDCGSFPKDSDRTMHKVHLC